MTGPESDGGSRAEVWASTSGGEVRVLHGVKAVDGGEQRRVIQGQAVAVSHMTQRVHVRVQTLET